MTDETGPILCAACHCPLEGPADANMQDRFACPVCGEGDTLENVLVEVKQSAEELIMKKLQHRGRKISRGNSSLDFTPNVQPKRRYRFIANLEA